MNKLNVTIFCLILLTIPSLSSAEVTNLQKGDLFELLNPFESQLPKPKIKVIAPLQNKKQQTTTRNNIQNPNNANIKAPDPVEKKKEIPKVKINGLVWNSTRPQAIVNGEVLDIGDKIQSFKIMAIKKTGIDISYYGKIVRINP